LTGLNREYFQTGSTGFSGFAFIFLPSRKEERKCDLPSTEKGLWLSNPALIYIQAFVVYGSNCL